MSNLRKTGAGVFFALIRPGFTKRDSNPLKGLAYPLELTASALEKSGKKTAKKYSTYEEVMIDNPEIEAVRELALKRFFRSRIISFILIILWQLLFWITLADWFGDGVMKWVFYCQFTLLSIGMLWRADFLHTMFLHRRAKFTFSEWLRLRVSRE